MRIHILNVEAFEFVGGLVINKRKYYGVSAKGILQVSNDIYPGYIDEVKQIPIGVS